MTYRYYSRTEPVGFTYHADCYCAECGRDLPDIDPEGNDKHPVMSWEKSEFCYPDDETGETIYHGCATCGETANNW